MATLGRAGHFRPALAPVERTLQAQALRVGEQSDQLPLVNLFATHHVKKLTNLGVVQEALSHASLATTGQYVHLARELMDRQLQQRAL